MFLNDDDGGDYGSSFEPGKSYQTANINPQFAKEVEDLLEEANENVKAQASTILDNTPYDHPEVRKSGYAVVNARDDRKSKMEDGNVERTEVLYRFLETDSRVYVTIPNDAEERNLKCNLGSEIGEVSLDHLDPEEYSRRDVQLVERDELDAELDWVGEE
jgi:hypothetical protein